MSLSKLIFYYLLTAFSTALRAPRPVPGIPVQSHAQLIFSKLNFLGLNLNLQLIIFIFVFLIFRLITSGPMGVLLDLALIRGRYGLRKGRKNS